MADYPSLYDAIRMPDDHEMEVVITGMQLFGQLQVWRNTFANQWEESAQLLMPEWRNSFYFGNVVWPGQKRTERQVDSKGMVCLSKFSAVCDAMVTPSTMIYQHITTNNDYLNKQRGVKQYYEDLTRILFQERYAPHSNFMGQQHQNYMFLGAFGNMIMLVEAYDDPEGKIRGLRYISIPIGEIYLTQNHQGQVDGFMRWYRMTARQCLAKFGKERFPPSMLPSLETNAQTLHDFVQWVCLRTDYKPELTFSIKGKRWASYHICLFSKSLVAEGGFNTFPIAVGRFTQVATEVYGRGPAQMTLPTLKSKNTMKGIFLTQGHLAVAPVYLVGDDALINMMSRRPGAMNPGGVTAEGKPLVHTLPIGDINFSLEMMQEEDKILDDMFYGNVFKLFESEKELTATQVIEMVNQRGMFLGPTMGRQQSEYLGSLTPRELDVLSQLDKLPSMPQVIAEAGGEFDMVWTSPLSKAMRAGEAAGIMRTIEFSANLAETTQDPSATDWVSIPRATQYVADVNMVPFSVMATPQEMAQKAQGRAQTQQAEQQIRATPGQAQMLSGKARMISASNRGAGASNPIPPPGIGAPIPAYGTQSGGPIGP